MYQRHQQLRIVVATRNEARNYALECREGWRRVKGTREKEQYLRLIKMLAQSSGFFSVWMNIFKDDAEVKKTLITVFKGTNDLLCKYIFNLYTIVSH